MAHTVFYDVVERYSQTNQGIVIPVVLRLSPEREVRLEAKLDTGADFCLFSRLYAENLGLEVEHGHRVDFSTSAGKLHRLRARSHTCRYEFRANRHLPLLRIRGNKQKRPW